MDKITYDDVINRIGYFRTKANLSMREASLQLGYNPQFMSTIENKTIELKVKTLLDFCNMLEKLIMRCYNVIVEGFDFSHFYII